MSAPIDLATVHAALTCAIEGHLSMAQTRLDQCKDAAYDGFIQYRHHRDVSEPRIREAYLFEGMARTHFEAHRDLTEVLAALTKAEAGAPVVT